MTKNPVKLNDDGDDFESLFARGLIASIPVAGPLLSIFVESSINKNREENLRQYCKEIDYITRKNQLQIKNIDAKLIKIAAQLSQSSLENWQPTILARIAVSSDSSLTQLHRRTLLDHVAQISTFDLFQFLSIADDGAAKNTNLPYLRNQFAELETQFSEIELLRTSSIEKLIRLSLIQRERSGDITTLTSTPLGNALIKYLS